MRKQPTTAFPLRLSHVFRGLRGIADSGTIRCFEDAFAEYSGAAHAIATGSGTAALFLLIEAAARLKPGLDEVVLPAYSVPTLIHAVRRTGLKPAYCDIDPETLNMDIESMEASVTDRTLALIPFHLFGFPMSLDRAVEIGRERNIFVFEDACQAIGAKLNGNHVGSICDAGFFSLCKGKIISTYRGGVVVMRGERLAAAVRSLNDALPPAEPRFRLFQPMVMAALSLAMRPGVYGSMYPLIARFKSATVHESFHLSRFTGYGGGLGRILLDEMDSWVSARRENGAAIMEGLRDDDGLILPRVLAGAEPAYNHAPVAFKDVRRLEEAQRRLFARGIDTARMYERPVHRIYPELGYPLDPDPFPGATYIAPRLLTLPTHPYLTREDIAIMIETIGETG